MKPDLNFELPGCDDAPPMPPPRLDNERYLKFIELNREMARRAGILQQLIENRPRPSEEVFELD